MTNEQRTAKLKKLAEIEVFPSLDDMIAATITDSVSPAICIAEDCDYTVEMEPDQDRGWCECCSANTVQSTLILAELI